MATVRTVKDNGSVVQFTGMEGTGADSTLKLSITAIVIVKIFMGGTTAWTDCIGRDITFGIFTDSDRLNEFTVSCVEVVDKFFVIILFRLDNDWWLIYFKFLILR